MLLGALRGQLTAFGPPGASCERLLATARAPIPGGEAHLGVPSPTAHLTGLWCALRVGLVAPPAVSPQRSATHQSKGPALGPRDRAFLAGCQRRAVRDPPAARSAAPRQAQLASSVSAIGGGGRYASAAAVAAGTQKVGDVDKGEHKRKGDPYFGLRWLDGARRNVISPELQTA